MKISFLVFLFNYIYLTSFVHGWTATPKNAEYRQVVQVCDIGSTKAGDSLIVPSGLTGWMIVFEILPNGRVGAGVGIDSQFLSAFFALRDVEWSVGLGTDNWFTRDFPAEDGGTNLGVEFLKSQLPRTECVDFHFALRFKKFSEQVQPLIDFTPNVFKTIGYLNAKEMEETQNLRTTPFQYKQNADDDEALLSTDIDLVQMARVSEWIRPMLRVDESTGEYAFKSGRNEIAFQYLTAETARDLDLMLHGARMTAWDFQAKDLEYLMRMGMAADFLLFTQLKKIIRDALYWRVRIMYPLEAKLAVILRVLEYGLTISDQEFVDDIMQVIQLHKYLSRADAFENIQTFLLQSGSGDVAVTALLKQLSMQAHPIAHTKNGFSKLKSKMMLMKFKNAITLEPGHPVIIQLLQHALTTGDQKRIEESIIDIMNQDLLRTQDGFEQVREVLIQSGQFDMVIKILLKLLAEYGLTHTIPTQPVGVVVGTRFEQVRDVLVESDQQDVMIKILLKLLAE